MSEQRDHAEPGRARVPRGRRAEREIGVRELRRPDKVVAALAESGAVGRITSEGRLVGWLMPPSEEDKRLEELTAAGRLRGARARGLAGRRPLPRRDGAAPLGQSLEQLRHEDAR